jgi:hypothetical protein
MSLYLRLLNLALLAGLAFAQNLRSSDSILEIAKSNEDLSTLVTALEISKLDDIFGCENWWCGYYTGECAKFL